MRQTSANKLNVKFSSSKQHNKTIPVSKIGRNILSSWTLTKPNNVQIWTSKRNFHIWNLFSKRSEHNTSTADPTFDLPHTPATDPPGVRKITIRYSFEGDGQHPRVFKTKIAADAISIKVTELYDLLVDDRVNLRTVSGIRYFKPKDRGFVKVSGDEILLSKALHDHTIALELEKSRSKALVIGPQISVDPNVGIIYNRLNPVLRLPFLACGQLFKRKYQADILTVGLKLDVSVRCQVFFCFRTPFRALYYHEPIRLGRGMELVWGLHVTWCSFADTSGGILMVGVPVGLAVGVSYITHGMLLPMQVEDANENFPVPTEPRGKEILPHHTKPSL